MAFKPFSKEEQDKIRQAGIPLSGRIEFDNVPPASGFTALDQVAASRMKPALTLEQILAEGHAGEILPESQPLGAFSRGALNSILAGTPEAAATLAGANSRSDSASPQFTNPNLFSAGEIAGSFLPLGRIGQTAKGVYRAITGGARLGGIYGAGQGVSSAAQSEDPTVSGAVTSGLIEGGKGTLLGAAIPATVGTIVKKLPTKQNILDDLMKISSGEEGKMQRSVSGGYVQAADKIAPFLKKEGVPEFLDATEKALEKEASIFRPTVEKANPSLVNPDVLYAEADRELAKLIPNAETRNELLLNSGDFLSDLTQITPQTLLQYAAKANREVSRIYKNPSTPITADGLAAKEAVRDAYGSAIRKILEAAGEDPSVYSGYGAIKEMASSVGKNYLQQTYKLSVQEAQGLRENILSGLEAKGSGLNVGRAVENVLIPLTDAGKGKMDRQTGKLIDGILGLKREKTNAGKAAKLDFGLKALNILNKNQSDPLETIYYGPSLISEEEP